MARDEPRNAGGPTRRTVLKAAGATAVAAGALFGVANMPTGGERDRSAQGDATSEVTSADDPADDPSERYFTRGPSIGLQTVADGPLISPVDFAAIEGTNRRLVADQVGVVYTIDSSGLLDDPFLDLRDRLVEVNRDSGADERGLLGLALHPEFPDTNTLYVRYSAPPTDGTPDDYSHTAVLSAFETTDDGRAADPDSERVLLEVPEPQMNHNAGALAFGPDGLLYVAFGDGGAARDMGTGHAEDWYETNEGGNGQDVESNLLGSILRIDVDGEGEEEPYAIPDDNPLVDGPGLDEVYAWGLRNPWRLSFNDGDLFVADVGQNRFEEVNVVEEGGNYGWNVREGTHCFFSDSEQMANLSAETGSSSGDATSGGETIETTTVPCPDHAPAEPPYDGQRFRDPIVEYPHTVGDRRVGSSVTGGFVYQGDAIPALQGAYVFGDWSRSFTTPAGRLLAARPPGNVEEPPGGATAKPEADTAESDGFWTVEELVVEGSPTGEINHYVLSFGRGADGELYVLTNTAHMAEGGGTVFKLVPPGEGDEIATLTPTPEPEETGAN